MASLSPAVPLHSLAPFHIESRIRFQLPISFLVRHIVCSPCIPVLFSISFLVCWMCVTHPRTFALIPQLSYACFKINIRIISIFFFRLNWVRVKNSFKERWSNPYRKLLINRRQQMENKSLWKKAQQIKNLNFLLWLRTNRHQLWKLFSIWNSARSPRVPRQFPWGFLA